VVHVISEVATAGTARKHGEYWVYDDKYQEDTSRRLPLQKVAEDVSFWEP